MAAEEVTVEELASMRRRDLVRFLESDARVREWLASGALLSTREAASFLHVERPRIWRWTENGRIRPVAKTAATPLFLRRDLERLRDQLAAEAAA